MQYRQTVTVRFSPIEWKRIKIVADALAVKGLKAAVIIKWLTMSGLGNFEEPTNKKKGLKA